MKTFRPPPLLAAPPETERTQITIAPMEPREERKFFRRRINSNILVALIFSLFLNRVQAQDHEKLNFCASAYLKFPASEEVPSPSDTDMKFATWCYDARTLEKLNCGTEWRIYYGVPENGPRCGAEQAFPKEYSGWHNHSVYGDDSKRPVGSIHSPLLPSSEGDEASRKVYGLTQNTGWTVTNTMPEAAGVVTVSGKYSLTPELLNKGYVWLENQYWKIDPADPTRHTVKGSFGYYVRSPISVISLDQDTPDPGDPPTYIRCGRNQCVDYIESDDPDHYSMSFSGRSGLVSAIRSLSQSYFYHTQQYHYVVDDTGFLTQVLDSTESLRITQIGLPYGGQYDSNADWKPLVLHRTGVAADLGQNSVMAIYDNSTAPPGITFTEQPVDTDWLEYIAGEYYGLTFRAGVNEPDLHYVVN